MKFINLLKIALKALNNNKLRCFLTMLGIIIGVASVITMLAIGQGSKISIKEQISEMGSNMIMIHPGNMQRGGVRQSSVLINFKCFLLSGACTPSHYYANLQNFYLKPTLS